MLIFSDFDSGHVENSDQIKLPDKVESICVMHDGGRITLCINGEDYSYETAGTRDCAITLDDS